MSIRTYNKDHLKEHADVSLSLLVNVDSPQSSDALVFWTRHEKEPCEVNLNRFASGQNSQFKHGSGKKFKPFSGRPKLISQLTPALKEALSYASKSTVNTYMRALREWWRILDRVEHSAETTGKTMTRVDDVSLLTQIHCDFAHRSGITRQSFGTFRALVNATRMALGLNQQTRVCQWPAVGSKRIGNHPKTQSCKSTYHHKSNETPCASKSEVSAATCCSDGSS